MVISLLNNVSVLHHQNNVSVTDRGKPVGHNKAGSALHHSRKRVLDFQLRSGINGRCRFVQNQHGRQTKHDTGDAEQLLLPLRKASSVLIDDGIVSIRQTLYKTVRV